MLRRLQLEVKVLISLLGDSPTPEAEEEHGDGLSRGGGGSVCQQGDLGVGGTHVGDYALSWERTVGST